MDYNFDRNFVKHQMRLHELSGAVTKIVQRTHNASDAKKLLPNTFIDEELRERVIMNKLLSHGNSDKVRFAEIQRENKIMLDKLYRI
jgi:hypothetical protein